MVDLPRGTVAFIFTDIEGSTVRWERDREAMAAAVDRHLAIIHSAVATNGGIHFKTVGDSVQVAFPTTAKAIAAALDAQRRLLAEDWSAVGGLPVRMALHVGEADPNLQGDYLAAPLNRLARLLATGYGGQILLSQAVQHLSNGALPPEVDLIDLGEHRLRDLLEPEHIFQLRHPMLPDRFPPLKSLGNRPTNLPLQPTPLLGREADTADVTRLLRDPSVRLLNLTGPGGIGKTRLAVQAATDLLEDFSDGVFFVSLAPLTDASLVPGAIVEALGMREAGDRPLPERLQQFLATKHLLLILDNVEHVAEAAPLIGDLLGSAPALKVLTTSRVPLHLRAEWEHPVPPLGLPSLRPLPPLEQLTRYPSVRLFLERARAVKPGFTIDSGNAHAVAKICHRLDGLPLAIELAAARTRMLAPHALLARLGGSLPLLTGGARDLPARQQTLRETIAWSHDLLTANEQTLFRRLAVFAGGAPFEAIEPVATAESEVDVFGGLEQLVEHSLVRQEDALDGEPRFSMLETIREFALEQLAAGGEEVAVRAEHMAWCLRLVEPVERGVHGPFGASDLAWLNQIDLEHHNIRAALTWAHKRSEAQLVVRFTAALARFWRVRGYLHEGRSWVEVALAYGDTGDPSTRLRLLQGAGLIAIALGDYPWAAALGEEGASLARQPGTSGSAGLSVHLLGVVALDQGQHAQAAKLFEEAQVLYQADGEMAWRPVALSHLGLATAEMGDEPRAVALWEEVLAHEENRFAVAYALQHLGAVLGRRGEFRAAAERFQQSLAVWQELGDTWYLASCLGGVAAVAAACREWEKAAKLLGAAEVLRETSGGTLRPRERTLHEETVAAVSAALHDRDFAAALADGRAMALADVIAAVGEIGRCDRASATVAPGGSAGSTSQLHQRPAAR